MYRQGDVYLQRIQGLPENAVQKERNGRLVLAEGEATGHAHAIADQAATLFGILEDGQEQLFLRADGEVVLRHEEHAPITIEEGLYRVVHQREYSPEAVRRVID